MLIVYRREKTKIISTYVERQNSAEREYMKKQGDVFM